MLQDRVQEGNTRVYLALLQWQDAANLLDEAESIWSGTCGVAASGLLRVLFYRRFLGVPGLLRSIRHLIKARKR